MKAVDFKERNVEIAKNQPEYNTLPAFANVNDGSFTYCFELSREEIGIIQGTGKIYFKQLVGGNEKGEFNPMQPIMASVNKHDLIPVDEAQQKG